RLFTELQEKNRALTKAHAQVTESLDQQTATSEILRVIASSPTDAQPVFDAIVKSASRLLGGAFTALTNVRGNALRLVAHQDVPGARVEAVEAWLRTYPRPLDDESQGVSFLRAGPVLSVAEV